MKVLILPFALLFVFKLNVCYAQDQITNKDVIAMKYSKVNESLILTKISSSKCNFDLSAQKLSELKDAKLSDKLIKQMIASSGQKPFLDNEFVIRLKEEKIPDVITLYLIRNAPHEFTTSPDDLIKLKTAGISKPILKEMMINPIKKNKDTQTAITQNNKSIQENPQSASEQNKDKITRPDYNSMKLMQVSNLLHEEGFVTKYGYVIKKGDTLVLGKGIQSNREFAYAYESKYSFLSGGSSDHDKKYLESEYANRSFKIKDLRAIGSKRKGFIIFALFNTGGGHLVNYWMEIDNAIDGGELILPEPYNSLVKKNNESQPTVVVQQSNAGIADELLKLKGLLDKGIISKDEFETQKKKLLDQK